MEKRKTKYLLFLLPFLCVVYVFFTGISVKTIATDETIPEETHSYDTVVEEKGESNFYDLNYGLGLSINVITAKNFYDLKTAHMVLDLKALKELPKKAINNRSTKGFEKSTVNIYETINDFNALLNLSEPDIFLNKLSKELVCHSKIEYQQYLSKYFYVLRTNVSRYNQYISNYINPATYQNAYSSGYLSDLELLSNGGITYESFFDKYGTHIAGSILVGGGLTATYSLATNEVAIDENNQGAIDKEVREYEFSEKTVKGIVSALDAKTDFKIRETDIKSDFYITTNGGKVLTKDDYKDFIPFYESWCESFNNPQNYAIVGYSYNGLVALWDILPQKYSCLADGMRTAFEIMKEDYKESFINRFGSHNELIIAKK